MDFQEYNNLSHALKLQHIHSFLAALPLEGEKQRELGIFIDLLYADTLSDSYYSGSEEGFNRGWDACEMQNRPKSN